jgi:hypothetical protein
MQAAHTTLLLLACKPQAVSSCRQAPLTMPQPPSPLLCVAAAAKLFVQLANLT